MEGEEGGFIKTVVISDSVLTAECFSYTRKQWTTVCRAGPINPLCLRTGGQACGQLD